FNISLNVCVLILAFNLLFITSIASNILYILVLSIEDTNIILAYAKYLNLFLISFSFNKISFSLFLIKSHLLQIIIIGFFSSKANPAIFTSKSVIGCEISNINKIILESDIVDKLLR